MSKAISTVIATILMLMITIALAGTAYLYISGTFTTKISNTFELIDSFNDIVTIRNSGTVPITSFSSVKIDGNDAVYRFSIEDSSLVGYWKLDEASGTTGTDSSGNGNTGSFSGSPLPTWVAGKFGNALKTTTTSGLRIGDKSILDFGTADFTISAWARTTNTENPDWFWTQIVINKKNNAGLQTAGYLLSSYGGKSAFQIANGTNYVAVISAATNLNNSNWHHLAGVKKGNMLYLYVDGNLDNTASTGSVGNIDTSTEFSIGIFTPPNMNGFNGDIDEVKIYNRALSENEIKANYNIGSQINPGEIATLKIYNPLSKGTHTLRLCTSSMCNTAYLTII